MHILPAHIIPFLCKKMLFSKKNIKVKLGTGNVCSVNNCYGVVDS